MMSDKLDFPIIYKEKEPSNHFSYLITKLHSIVNSTRRINSLNEPMLKCRVWDREVTTNNELRETAAELCYNFEVFSTKRNKVVLKEVKNKNPYTAFLFGVEHERDLRNTVAIYNNYEIDLLHNLSEDAEKKIKKINSFYLLDNNWDQEGALKVSKIAIEKSIEFIKYIDRYNYKVFFVNPTSDGGVALELREPAKLNKLIIEFSIKGTPIYFKIKNNKVVYREELKRNNYQSVLSWLIY